MRSPILPLALALAIAVPVAAQTPAPSSRLTIADAVAEALRNRPLLTGAAERAEAARARIGQAQAALRPRVDLQAAASDGLPGAPQVFIGGLAGSPFKKYVGGSVTVVQTLLDFGRTHANVRARRAEAAASAESLRADQQRVALEVRQAFLQALQARRLAEVNRQIVEQRRLVARQAETLRANGLSSRVDVDLAEVAVSQAELAVVRATGDVEAALAALGAAIGRPLSPGTELEDVVSGQWSVVSGQLGRGAPTPGPSPNSGGGESPSTAAVPNAQHPTPNTFAAAVPAPEEATAAALRDRPEVRQQELQIRAAEGLVEAARAGNRPRLDALGSVGKVNPSPLIRGNDDPYAVALVFTFPVFTGGLVEAQTEEARRNAAAARAAREELANQVRQQVAATLANLRAAEAGIRVAEAQLTRAADAQSLATQRYQAQLGSIVELVQAQTAFAQAQYDRVRATYELELARAALEFALGRPAVPATAGEKAGRG